MGPRPQFSPQQASLDSRFLLRPSPRLFQPQKPYVAGPNFRFQRANGANAKLPTLAGAGQQCCQSSYIVAKMFNDTAAFLDVNALRNQEASA